MSLGFRHIAALSCAATLAACGSNVEPDEPDGSGPPSASASASPDASSGQGKAGGRGRAAPDGQDDAAPRPARNADGSPLEVTGDRLCADLPAAKASQVLGVEVDDVRAGDGATPQCTYSYTNGAGNDSTFTVAAMRPADIGGRVGLEAFDYMVELSRGLAGPVDLDQRDVDAGDKAVRISGGGLHTGVLAAAGYLLTVTVPEADADAGRVDALVTEVAQVLAA